VFLLGTAKIAIAIELLWKEQGGVSGRDRHPYVARTLSAVGELAFPKQRDSRGWQRLRSSALAALHTLRHGAEAEVPASSLDPEGRSIRATSVWDH
jgi:hypothetical protein